MLTGLYEKVVIRLPIGFLILLIIVGILLVVSSTYAPTISSIDPCARYPYEGGCPWFRAGD